MAIYFMQPFSNGQAQVRRPAPELDNAWRNFAVQKLTGNDSFDVEDNSPEDWPEPAEWNILRKEYETCHQNLLMAIKNFPVEKWHSMVPLRSYSFLYLINGIVEHDYYHFGQINVLLAAIRKMEG